MAHHSFPTRNARGHLGIAVAAAVMLAAGLVRADSIVVKRDAGTSTIEGAIEEINAGEVVYSSAAGDREASAPIAYVLQIKAPKEPELSAAEQAFAEGKWADAVTLYHRTLSLSLSDWAKYRATVRLIDAGGRSQDFGLQAEAFVKLAGLDPAGAAAHQPETKGLKKDDLAAALKAVQDGVAGAGPEAKIALLPFLADLRTANDEPKLAAEARRELEKLLFSQPTVAELPGSDGIGPHGAVFGFGGDAREITFVCDGCGSMLGKAASLKNELQKAVAGLKRIQAFNIIFFQETGCTALDTKQFVMGDAANKRLAYRFIDGVGFKGTADPIPGLKMAFEQHPQLIYLLTDGDFPDNKAVKDLIVKLNADHKVRINTIAYEGDPSGDFIDLLKQIARDNGGTFRHVWERDLND